VPALLAPIVTRLLKKTPDARFQSAADLAWALEQLGHRSTDLGASRERPREATTPWRSGWLPWLAAPAMTASLLTGGWWLSPQVSRQPSVTQFTWMLPAGMVLDSAPVVSADGERVVFVGKDVTGRRLFVRDLSSLAAVSLSGTEGAKQPFMRRNEGQAPQEITVVIGWHSLLRYCFRLCSRPDIAYCSAPGTSCECAVPRGSTPPRFESILSCQSVRASFFHPIDLPWRSSRPRPLS